MSLAVKKSSDIDLYTQIHGVLNLRGSNYSQKLFFKWLFKDVNINKLDLMNIDLRLGCLNI